MTPPPDASAGRDLSNLASILRATNRRDEAEALLRRNLLILLGFSRRTGHQHPHLFTAFGNYFVLLQEMGKSQSEIDAMLKALGSYD